MKVTKVLTVNIENVPVTDQGKRVYKALLSTGIKTTEELSKHLEMNEGTVDLMLVHLYSFDLIGLEG